MVFERYFCARVVARLRAAPYAVHLEGFTAYLHQRGHSRLTVQNYVRAAELFVSRLRRCRRPLSSFNEARARNFANRGQPANRPRPNVHASLRLLLGYLRDRGVVSARSINNSSAIIITIADYDIHLRDAAGLAAATRLYRRRYAAEFLRRAIGSGPIRWNCLRPEQVRDFVSHYGRSGHPAAAQVAASSIAQLSPLASVPRLRGA